MKQVVLATGNAGKVNEMNSLLAQLGWQVLPQSQFAIPDAIEDGLTFVENAIIKARHAARLTGLPAIADDSGLEVAALGGQPGIYSARYAGEPGNDGANNAKLLQALEGQSDRRARFVCCLVYLRHAEDPVPVISQGFWQGEIALSAKGEQGFGYDPLFIDPRLGCHAAELEKAQKSAVSHRGQALAQLVAQLKAL